MTKFSLGVLLLLLAITSTTVAASSHFDEDIREFEDAAIKYFDHMERAGNVTATIVNSTLDGIRQLSFELEDLRIRARVKVASTQLAFGIIAMMYSFDEDALNKVTKVIERVNKRINRRAFP